MGQQKIMAGSKTYTITKKIAKHGNQSIIVVPSILKNKIKPRMLVKVTIDILDSDLGGEG